MACNSLRSRKAISPILATLLLVVIAVAAIVVTYAWVMTYMAHTTGQAGVVLYPANVRFYGNGTKIDIDIQEYRHFGHHHNSGLCWNIIFHDGQPDNHSSAAPSRHCSENNSELLVAGRYDILFQSDTINRYTPIVDPTSTKHIVLEPPF